MIYLILYILNTCFVVFYSHYKFAKGDFMVFFNCNRFQQMVSSVRLIISFTFYSFDPGAGSFLIN